MRKGAFGRRLIPVLCLILFQAQSLAAWALDCLHEADRVSPVDCPFHTSVAGDQATADGTALNDAAAAQGPVDADANLLDCPKCALHLALHHAAIDSCFSMSAPPRRSEAPPLSCLHFCSFVPELLTKPPISCDG